MNKYKKMTKVELQEIIRSYTDFSKYTREEMLDEIFEEIKSEKPFSEARETMEEFLEEDIPKLSDEELEEYFRKFYCSDWTRRELLREINRHEHFKELSREELEKDYADFKQYIHLIIVGTIMSISIISLTITNIVSSDTNNSKVSDKKIEALEQKIEQQEEKIDSLENVINAIIDVIVSEPDNISPMI